MAKKTFIFLAVVLFVGALAGGAIASSSGESHQSGQALTSWGGEEFVPGDTVNVSAGEEFVPEESRIASAGEDFVPGGYVIVTAGEEFVPGGNEFAANLETSGPIGTGAIPATGSGDPWMEEYGND